MDSDLLKRYNYDAFIPENFEQWMRFDQSPPIGVVAPDFPLWYMEDRTETSLQELWSNNLYLVVEFGSFTWPYCGMAGPSMNAVAEKYASDGVKSVFLYTNEAHPGENYRHHLTMDDKFHHARALRDVLGVTRQIVVDSLDGACHRTYGSMPNMTWIFNRSGLPIYKSDWTDAHSVENALIYFLDISNRRKDRERLAPFRVERLDYRNADRLQFFEGLRRNGPQSVQDFIDTFGPPPPEFKLDE